LLLRDGKHFRLGRPEQTPWRRQSGFATNRAQGGVFGPTPADEFAASQGWLSMASKNYTPLAQHS